MENIGYYLWNL